MSGRTADRILRLSAGGIFGVYHLTVLFRKAQDLMTQQQQRWRRAARGLAHARSHSGRENFLVLAIREAESENLAFMACGLQRLIR